MAKYRPGTSQDVASVLYNACLCHVENGDIWIDVKRRWYQLVASQNICTLFYQGSPAKLLMKLNGNLVNFISEIDQWMLIIMGILLRIYLDSIIIH